MPVRRGTRAGADNIYSKSTPLWTTGILRTPRVQLEIGVYGSHRLVAGRHIGA